MISAIPVLMPQESYYFETYIPEHEPLFLRSNFLVEVVVVSVIRFVREVFQFLQCCFLLWTQVANVPTHDGLRPCRGRGERYSWGWGTQCQ